MYFFIEPMAWSGILPGPTSSMAVFMRTIHSLRSRVVGADARRTSELFLVSRKSPEEDDKLLPVDHERGQDSGVKSAMIRRRQLARVDHSDSRSSGAAVWRALVGTI